MKKWLIPVFAGSLLITGSCGEEGTTSIDPIPPATVDVWPKWSPVDSTEIAYTHFARTLDEARELGDVSVWILNTVTGLNSHLAEGIACDWSPDGQQILLSRNGIWILDLASGEKQNLTCGDGELCQHGAADVSPDGEQVAYVQGNDPGWGMWVLELASMSKARISDYNRPDWSPDGTEILCDSLIVIRPDGSRVRAIPHDGLNLAVHARWSPDGSQIALGGEDAGGRGGIWIIDPDGSELRFLTRGATPSWSPDGGRIAYSAVDAEANATAIWMINSDGTGRRQLTIPYTDKASGS